jgi:hypothetical protein
LVELAGLVLMEGTVGEGEERQFEGVEVGRVWVVM